ncbi:MAG: hypothetical protein H7326_11495 [Bdellovibrionaceae bacterium]|nr:hypothetical protein [Pseudobdellovibrionaceae bacterium]
MKTTVMIMFAIFVGNFAEAGAISGGGGKAVVCRNADGIISSARTLDLYEGEVLYNLKTPPDVKLTVPEKIQRALAIIPNNSRGTVQYYARQVWTNMRIVDNVVLQPVDDALVVALPKGCLAEQLANYYNDTLVLINGEIWNALSSTEQAALVLHEAVYASERLLGSTNSLRSRHVVASLFSPVTAWTDIDNGLPKDRIRCVGEGVMFSAIPDADGVWNLYFNLLGRGQVFSQKFIRVSNPEIDFAEAKKQPILKGEDKIGLKYGTSGYLKSTFENNDTIYIEKVWQGIKDQDGKRIPGYQTPKYSFTWKSSTYPESATPAVSLNCSLVIP